MAKAVEVSDITTSGRYFIALAILALIGIFNIQSFINSFATERNWPFTRTSNGFPSSKAKVDGKNLRAANSSRFNPLLHI